MNVFDKNICRLCASKVMENYVHIFSTKLGNEKVLSDVGAMMLDCLFTKVNLLIIPNLDYFYYYYYVVLVLKSY